MDQSYRQPQKNKVRHSVIRRAIELLTVLRSEACCVRNSYVRDVYEYFLSKEESHECEEASKIKLDYIREWEKLHLNAIGSKKSEELSVCYLSGPEPNNDFCEFISMGVLPENIWAIENKKDIYNIAVNSLNLEDFKQPKIIRTSIEQFFENTPKKFDIVYVDACASLISDQHALRSVATLFQFHRLNSPGILITNFAGIDKSNKTEVNQYLDIISRYIMSQNNQPCFVMNEGKKSNVYNKWYSCINSSLDERYGDFVTQMICDAASISIPTLRFVNSQYLKTLTDEQPLKFDINKMKESYITNIKYNTLTRFFIENSFISQMFPQQYDGISKVDKLSDELSGKNSYHFKLFDSFAFLYSLKLGKLKLTESLNSALKFYSESNGMYQFLDKPNENLFFDTVINQLSYPMHYVANQSKRYTYIAKKQRMFTDLILFDECRYIYDWIPAVNQLKQSFSNLSWQYTFRFGLDGLIKQRINYNNEFFFQGSVISKKIPGFVDVWFPKREKIN